MAFLVELRERLVSLEPWIKLCQRADVPYVPAEFSEPFPAGSIMDAIEGEPHPKLVAAFKWAEAELLKPGREHWVMRWECGMSCDVKFCMGRGQIEKAFEAARRGMTCDDSRAAESAPWGALVPDEQGNTRLCIRPWVDAEIVDGYPVEFRVYADATGIIGVSSYYPQRPLPASYTPYVSAARAWSRTLYSAGKFPVGFTADFLLARYDELLFLEGGPPHVAGAEVSAHPCCFAPGQIKGIALERREGAMDQ